MGKKQTNIWLNRACEIGLEQSGYMILIVESITHRVQYSAKHVRGRNLMTCSLFERENKEDSTFESWMYCVCSSVRQQTCTQCYSWICEERHKDSFFMELFDLHIWLSRILSGMWKPGVYVSDWKLSMNKSTVSKFLFIHLWISPHWCSSAASLGGTATHCAFV